MKCDSGMREGGWSVREKDFVGVVAQMEMGHEKQPLVESCSPPVTTTEATAMSVEKDETVEEERKSVENMQWGWW